MPRSVFVGSFSYPKMEFAIDMGNPFFNRTVDGFLKIGAVGASKVLAEETYDCLRKGTVAGVYVGMEYGMERIRGTRDWKNAMLGGALTGAFISAASNNGRDKVIRDAITAGAVATATELVYYLT